MNIHPSTEIGIRQRGEVAWEDRTKNFVVTLLFLSLFFAPALGRLIGPLGRLSDLVIAVVGLVVVARLIGSGSARNVPFRYFLVFLAFCYVVSMGVLVNQVSPLIIAAGVRTYFKYVPLFLLPFVFRYSSDDLKWQFKLLTTLALLQLPVTLWQRFIQYRHLFTGDVITGTLAISNSLSILMISFITVLIAMYWRGRISLTPLLILALLLFLPCTLNETKVTVFLLPMSVAAVVFVMRREIAPQKLLLLSMAGMLLLGAFIAIYDRLYASDVGFGGLVTDEHRMLDNYNLTGNQATPNALDVESKHISGEVKSLREEDVPVGRFDSFLIATKSLFRHDPVLLLTGLGIGNVDSSLGGGGAYRLVAEQLDGTGTALAQLLWETGLIGTAVFVIFLILVLRDAAVLSRRCDEWGILGASWFAVTIIIIITLPYNNIFHFNEIAGFFILFSGMIVYRIRTVTDNA